MGKAKFLLPLVGILLLGVAGFAAKEDACSYTPGGSFDLRLAYDGIRHQLNQEADCDPWAVVEPDRAVQSVTIVPYDNWTDAPSRPVTVSADGTIAISEPLDREGMTTRVLESVVDRPLATQLLQDLQRFTSFNRMTTIDPVRFAETLPEDADSADIRTYMVEPTTRCWGQLYDGGGIRLEFVDDRGRKRTSILDSFCASPSMTQAMDKAWDIRETAFERARFRGEHYADNLATY